MATNQTPSPAGLQGSHTLQLTDQQRFVATGVSEILRFDDSAVALKTVRGLLLIKGEGLHLKSLLPQGGEITVLGTVRELTYTGVHPGRGLLARLFG